MPPQNLRLVLPTDLADQLAEPQTDHTGQHRLPLLGRPDEVQVDLEDAMCSMPVIHRRCVP
jgi:hypothetical protein